jgi:hypothetical protein
MGYKKFEDKEACIKAIIDPIDMRRTVMLLNDPELKFKNPKNKSIKKVLADNLKYIFPDSVYQVGSEVSMAFTRFDPKLIGQIGDFWFVGVNVYPLLSAPIFIALFVDEDNNVSYFVPAQGNTFNVLAGKPFGQDQTDEASCKAICGCTIEELCVKPEKYQNMDIIKQEICDQFCISTYSMLIKHDIHESTENWFEFTKNKNNEELL